MLEISNGVIREVVENPARIECVLGHAQPQVTVRTYMYCMYDASKPKTLGVSQLTTPYLIVLKIECTHGQ